jgi:hypothetical protein
VHWVSGLGVMPGHWAHQEPAPHEIGYYVVLELDAERDPETDTTIRRRVGGGSYRTLREANEALDDTRERARLGWLPLG